MITYHYPLLRIMIYKTLPLNNERLCETPVHSQNYLSLAR